MSKRQSVPRGSGINRVMVGFRVDRNVKAKVDAFADDFRVSQSVLIEGLLRSITVDADGRISGVLKLEDAETQQELPMVKTA